MEGVRLCDNKPPFDLLPSDTPDQYTHIVSSLSVVQLLIESFNTDTLRLEGLVVPVKLKLVININLALLDRPAGHSTSPLHVVSALNCHEKGLVLGTPTQLDPLVHGCQQLFNALLSELWILVLQVVEGRPSDKSRFFRIVVVFAKEVFKLLFDQVQHLGFLHHVHLVHENKDVTHTNLATQQHMLLGLGHRSVNSRHHQNTRVHLSSPSDHVLDVVDVPGTVDVCIVTSICLVLNGGSVDGDTSGLLFRGLVDLAVLDILGCVLGSEVLGNGGG